MTKIGAFPRFFEPNGSGVFFGSRFFSYSASLVFGTRLACLLRAPPALLLRLRDRFTERGHQVDDLALLFLPRLRELGALRLGLDQVEQLLAVRVVVLLRLEVAAEVLDE